MASTLTWALVALAVCAVAVPVPEMQEIRLQVPAELLKDHRLVLTLSSLAGTGKTLTSAKETVGDGGTPADDESQREGKRGRKGGGGGGQKPEEENVDSTTVAPSDTNPDETTESGSKKPGGGEVTITPGPPVLLPEGGDTKDGVDQLILHFPRVACPTGTALDMSGKCREFFNPLKKGKAFDQGASPDTLESFSNAQHIPE